MSEKSQIDSTGVWERLLTAREKFDLYTSGLGHSRLCRAFGRYVVLPLRRIRERIGSAIQYFLGTTRLREDVEALEKKIDQILDELVEANR